VRQPKIPKDPLTPTQRQVLSNLVARGGQIPAYDLRDGATHANLTTRRALERNRYIELRAVVPFRNELGQKVLLDAAQITRDGLDAVNWPTGDGSYQAHMLAFAETDAYAEHEIRHPAIRDYRDVFTYRLNGEVLGGVVGNQGDTVEIDFCIDVHERGLVVTFTTDEAQHLSRTIAAAWSAARTHRSTP
jgi:hypothetical protein